MTSGTHHYAAAHIARMNASSLQQKLVRLKAGHLAGRRGIRPVASNTELRIMRIARSADFYLAAAKHNTIDAGLVLAHFGMFVAFASEASSYAKLIAMIPELAAYERVILFHPSIEHGPAYPAFVYEKSNPQALPSPLEVRDRKDIPDGALCVIASPV